MPPLGPPPSNKSNLGAGELPSRCLCCGLRPPPKLKVGVGMALTRGPPAFAVGVVHPAASVAAAGGAAEAATRLAPKLKLGVGADGWAAAG